MASTVCYLVELGADVEKMIPRSPAFDETPRMWEATVLGERVHVSLIGPLANLDFINLRWAAVTANDAEVLARLAVLDHGLAKLFGGARIVRLDSTLADDCEEAVAGLAMGGSRAEVFDVVLSLLREKGGGDRYWVVVCPAPV